MKYFYDTEFLEDGRTIELISIGIVCEDGREYYAVNSDLPIDRIRKHDWLLRNVMPSLPLTNRAALNKYIDQSPNLYPKMKLETLDVDTKSSMVKPHWVIANEVRDFLLAARPPELWAWFSAYDHVVLAQLWGTMLKMPPGIPMYTSDIRSMVDWTGIDKLPEQAEGVHNALSDARHNKRLYEHILKEANLRP